MGWLFGQVWILCALAFLAGAAVTWVLFVRSAPRRGSGVGPAGPTGMAPWATSSWAGLDDEPTPPEPTPVGPPVDSALSALDSGGLNSAAATRRTPGAGVAATGALDRLGVTGAPQGAATSADPAPDIPVPSRPVDAPPEIPAQAGPPDTAAPRSDENGQA